MRRPEDNAFSGEESLAPINLTVPGQLYERGDLRTNPEGLYWLSEVVVY